jgi:hypothetical protein
MSDVYEEVRAERAAQDAKWGGPEHDDAHDADDWLDYIARKGESAMELVGEGSARNDTAFRRRMIQIAALAVACVESMDRQMGAGNSPT